MWKYSFTRSRLFPLSLSAILAQGSSGKGSSLSFCFPCAFRVRFVLLPSQPLGLECVIFGWESLRFEENHRGPGPVEIWKLRLWREVRKEEQRKREKHLRRKEGEKMR